MRLSFRSGMKPVGLTQARLAANLPWTMLLAGLCLLAPAGQTVAADREFVGNLATAVAPESAQALALSTEQLHRLLQLAGERETAAVDLVMSLRSATAQEKAARLAAFRIETEQLSAKILRPDQVALLRKIDIKQRGLASLAEAALVQELGLSPAEQTEVDKLLAERKMALAAAPPSAVPGLTARYEASLFAALEPSTRQRWEALTTEAPSQAAAEQGVATTSSSRPAVESVSTEGSESLEQDPAPTAGQIAATSVADEAEESERASTATATSNPSAEGSPSDAPQAATMLRFSFRHRPWSQVIEWFAEQNDLSLVMPNPPEGTFNYTDSKEYSPAEALEVLNRVLQIKGFTLVRADRMLFVINTEDGIPPNLIPFVAQEKLPEYGDYQLVSTLFRLTGLTTQEAMSEIDNLKGPQGTIVSLPKSNQLLITETVGNLKRMQAVLQRAENPGEAGEAKSVDLTPGRSQEVLKIARKLLGVAEDSGQSADGGLRLAVESNGTRVWLSGRPEMVTKAVKTLASIDKEGSIADSTQLQTYTIQDNDPAATLAILQSLVKDSPDAKLTLEPKSGRIVVEARMEQQEIIRNALQQLQSDPRKPVVIRLRKLEPQAVALQINKLFGGTAEKGSTAGPMVTPDVLNRQIIVKGTIAQLAEVRGILEQLGEGNQRPVSDGGTLRAIPLSSSTARKSLDQLEEVWKTVSPRKLKIIRQEAGIQVRSLYQNEPAAAGAAPRPANASNNPAEKEKLAGATKARNPAPARPAEGDQSEDAEPAARSPAARKPAAPTKESVPDEARRRRTFDHTPAAEQLWLVSDGEASATSAESATAAQPAATEAIQTPPQEETPEAIVVQGPGGLMLRSDDPVLLDQLEEVLGTITSNTPAGGTEFVVFYLKHAKADAAAVLVAKATGAQVAGGSGGSGVVGEMANAAFGEKGGGLVTGLMGLEGDSGSGLNLGSAMLIPDTRLNSILVKARSQDIDTVEQLLRLIDQPGSPEDIAVVPKPRLIPIYNTNASSIAEMLKSVYADRLGGNTGRQPSPEDFIRAMRNAGRGGGGGGGGGGQEEATKMTLGVDERSNSLVVAAPDALFQEVEALVAQLDVAGIGPKQAVVAVSIQKSNSATMQRALASILGPQARTQTASSNTNANNNNNNRGRGNAPFGGGFPGGGFPGGGFPGGGFPGGGFPGGGFPGGGFPGGGFPGGGFPGGGGGFPGGGGGGRFGGGGGGGFPGGGFPGGGFPGGGFPGGGFQGGRGGGGGGRGQGGGRPGG